MKQQKIKRSSTILIKAIRDEDYEAVKNLLQKGSNVNEVDYERYSPLHHAIILRNFKITKLLLRYNAQVNIKDGDGFTPIDYALVSHNFNITNILLKYKAKIYNHRIPMMIQLKYPENLKKLVYENIDVKQVDSSGYTALHHAINYNDLNGIRTLISRGANVNKFANKHQKLTSLHLAKSTECVKILLQKGARPNVRNKSLQSPLCELINKLEGRLDYPIPIERKEQQRMIEELIRNNANCIDAIYNAKKKYSKVESRYGFKEVLKFMALKEHVHHYTNIEYFKLNYDNVSSSFYRRCLNEVALLKEEKLLDYLTYYDFVAKNIHELSKYVDNKSIKEAFKDKSKLMIMFPVYSEILWRHFEDATEERKLRQAACSSLSYAIPCINEGHIATYRILNFIEIKDMKNLVKAFPSVKLQNNK